MTRVLLSQPVKVGIQKKHVKIPSPGRNPIVQHSTRLYNVRSPSDVSWFRFAPVTIVIRCYLRTINHSYWSYVHQLNAIDRGPHIVGVSYWGFGIGWPLKTSEVMWNMDFLFPRVVPSTVMAQEYQLQVITKKTYL